jgi:transposase-like protein
MSAASKDQQDFWKKTVESFKASGLSGKEFARQNGIKSSQLYYWHNKLNTEESSPIFKLAYSNKPVQSRAVIKLGALSLDLEELPSAKWIAELSKEVLS